jgi:anti-sigma factor RsiW
VIEKLENNEQILLMYLAGELPAEDRADVEQMLASDVALRRDWEQIQSLHAVVEEGLGQLDETSLMPMSTHFAVRQVGRAIRQKLARPKIAPAAMTNEGQPRSWWWLYPTVAAASVAIIAMVWLNRQVSPTSMPAPVPAMGEPNSLADARNAGEDDDTLLLDSLSPADRSEAKPASDEDPKQVASVGDSIPQDEISQYLLSATSPGQ